MEQDIFVGVDGGATKTIICVEDATGKRLGQEVSGPASIRLSVAQAWQSINSALERILLANRIFIEEKKFRLHAGMGLAGSELHTNLKSFLATPHHFSTLHVVSDAHIACLGAHSGRNGAVIAIGTGVVGYAIHADDVAKVSGWGFPQDDLGGGAWMGLEAMRVTLQSLDGRIVASGLSRAVHAHFKQDTKQLVAWANQANSTAFAELAPIVIQQSKEGDVHALRIMQQAAQHIESIAYALRAKHQLKCALIGGLATELQAYLSLQLQKEFIPCENPAEVGAMLFIRQQLAKERMHHE